MVAFGKPAASPSRNCGMLPGQFVTGSYLPPSVAQTSKISTHAERDPHAMSAIGGKADMSLWSAPLWMDRLKWKGIDRLRRAFEGWKPMASTSHPQHRVQA